MTYRTLGHLLEITKSEEKTEDNVSRQDEKYGRDSERQCKDKNHEMMNETGVTETNGSPSSSTKKLKRQGMVCPIEDQSQKEKSIDLRTEYLGRDLSRKSI